jgi:hypothetical protein
LHPPSPGFGGFIVRPAAMRPKANKKTAFSAGFFDNQKIENITRYFSLEIVWKSPLRIRP